MDLSIFEKIINKAKNSAEYSKEITIEGLLTAKFKIVDVSVDRKISAAMVDVYEATTHLASESAFDYVRRYTIAHYLETLEGKETPHGIMEGSGEEAEDLVAEKLSELPAFVIDVLYSACVDLRQEYRSKINSGVKCTWFDKPYFEISQEPALERTNPMTVEVEAQEDEPFKEDVQSDLVDEAPPVATKTIKAPRRGIT